MKKLKNFLILFFVTLFILTGCGQITEEDAKADIAKTFPTYLEEGSGEEIKELVSKYSTEEFDLTQDYFTLYMDRLEEKYVANDTMDPMKQYLIENCSLELENLLAFRDCSNMNFTDEDYSLLKALESDYRTLLLVNNDKEKLSKLPWSLSDEDKYSLETAFLWSGAENKTGYANYQDVSTKQGYNKFVISSFQNYYGTIYPTDEEIYYVYLPVGIELSNDVYNFENLYLLDPEDFYGTTVDAYIQLTDSDLEYLELSSTIEDDEKYCSEDIIQLIESYMSKSYRHYTIMDFDSEDNFSKLIKTPWRSKENKDVIWYFDTYNSMAEGYGQVWSGLDYLGEFEALDNMNGGSTINIQKTDLETGSGEILDGEYQIQGDTLIITYTDGSKSEYLAVRSR